jgi:lipoic acid synthetase
MVGSAITGERPGYRSSSRRCDQSSQLHYLVVAIEIPVEFVRPREPKPEWLKVRAPGSENYLRLKSVMKELRLHTVCEEARCPNIGECWHHGTATFMILGDVCTRACAYCAVSHGRPNELDLAEPARVADAIDRMTLRHAVITSVDRDDLADGGASMFAETIRLTRERVPGCRIEVLIPDFQGAESSLTTVLDAGPNVLNHNIETVPRLYRMARSGGKYLRSLDLLDRSRRYRPAIATKTGMMVGLGEEVDEVVSVFDDLRRVGVSILTIGQYLRPTLDHAPMTRYYHPDEFAALKRLALERGFVHVESGPLVRSSYHAHEQADAYESSKFEVRSSK